MAVLIKSVDEGSPASRAGVHPGETLVSISGNPVQDVLDYRFYMTEPRLELELRGGEGETRFLKIRKGQYDDLGLEFDTYLMDRQHH